MEEQALVNGHDASDAPLATPEEPTVDDEPRRPLSESRSPLTIRETIVLVVAILGLALQWHTMASRLAVFEAVQAERSLYLERRLQEIEKALESLLRRPSPPATASTELRHSFAPRHV